jgi:hypothetical protein
MLEKQVSKLRQAFNGRNITMGLSAGIVAADSVLAAGYLTGAFSLAGMVLAIPAAPVVVAAGFAGAAALSGVTLYRMFKNKAATRRDKPSRLAGDLGSTAFFGSLALTMTSPIGLLVMAGATAIQSVLALDTACDSEIKKTLTAKFNQLRHTNPQEIKASMAAKVNQLRHKGPAA